MAIVKNQNFMGKQYWKIAPGENARQWAECLDNGYIAIGWEEMGDVSGLSQEEFKQRRLKVLAEHPDLKNSWSEEYGVSQLWKFVHDIKQGDYIVANRGTKEVLGIGIVTGSYFFVPNVKHGNRLAVNWIDLTRRDVNKKGWTKTLIRLNQEKFIEICPEFPYHLKQVKLQTEYTLADCADQTGIDETKLELWIRNIQRKKQVVIYGSPGTGKTFIAEKLAKHLIGDGDGFSELVQFHPAYSYEDFIQGIRPQSEDGKLSYPLVLGRFLEFCQEAEKRQGICVLIIDEINRANLAYVFGELMYLLEYRNKEIPLAGGNRFHIPSNVRIIGTMNTADRSIATVDYALRRRFAFIELRPNYDVLERYHQKTGFPAKDLRNILEELNKVINDKHYEIGISFFITDSLNEDLEDIWLMEIEPYLEEYFFNQPEKVDEFRWEKVKHKLSL